MWASTYKKYFYWKAIEDDFNHLLRELDRAETEEDGDLYRLMMHCHKRQELNVFDADDRREIKHLLSILIKETRVHQRTLSRVVSVLSSYKKEMLKYE